MQTILVVDDEQNIRNILDFSLGSEGYRVISACDGAQAYDLALEHCPDLIILDVMMPGGDGITTCRLLKDDVRTTHIPVILLTAKSSRDDRERGQSARADAYMTKPFSPQRLIGKVQSLLGVTKS